MATFEGVKFYSVHDLSVSTSLLQAEEVLDQFSEHDDITDINRIIELHNIKLFFENDLRLLKWSDEKNTIYKEKAKMFEPIIGRFFTSINDSNLLQILNHVSNDYIDDFWFLFNRYKLFQRISEEEIEKAIQSNYLVLSAILKQKQTVSQYGAYLTEALMSRCNSAELLLSIHTKGIGESDHALNFPKELTSDAMNQIFEEYIRSKDANPNYLLLIAELNLCVGLSVSDKTRLHAKRRYETIMESLFSTDSKPGMLDIKLEVIFSDSQIEEKSVQSISDGELSISYGSEWIEDNLDYPTLLNNFIYLFEYVDGSFRSHFVALPSEMSVFERLVGLRGKSSYETGYLFQIRHSLFNMQMQGYLRLLVEYGINIEEIFQWFFETYLPDEFSALGFSFKAPTVGIKTVEKCKLLLSEMESILKQYSLYVCQGSIDRDLLEISSTPVRIEKVPSLLEQKYLYPKSDECYIAMNLYFSDQSTLTLIDSADRGFDTFDEMITNFPISVDLFADYQKTNIDWLVNRGCLAVDECGIITPIRRKMIVLKSLYYNQVCCLQYLPGFREQIESMQMMEEIRIESSLFSEPEQSYYNYMLNRFPYTNGPDLRNKYAHGSHPLEEEDHLRDYIELLKIMVLAVIKINEEFCLVQPLVE